MIITSTKNDHIKYLKLLQSKSKLRLEENCFVAEGTREMQIALSNGIEVLKVYINTSIYEGVLDFKDEVEVIEISEKVYRHIAYRSSTEGIIGICKTPSHRLTDVNLTTPNHHTIQFGRYFFNQNCNRY